MKLKKWHLVKKIKRKQKDFEREQLLQPEVTAKRQMKPTEDLQKIYDEHKYR